MKNIIILLILLSLVLNAKTYQYDNLNRLTLVTYKTGERVHYSYDAGGNLLDVRYEESDLLKLYSVPLYTTENKISFHLVTDVFGTLVVNGVETTIGINNKVQKIELDADQEIYNLQIKSNNVLSNTVSFKLYEDFNIQLKEQKLAVQVTNGSKAGKYLLFYRLDIEEEKTISIDMKASFDTYLSINDMQLNILHEDDNGGDGTNSRLENITLSAGSYYIEATAAQIDVSGQFSLDIVDELDSDSDGISDIRELELNMNPNSNDSDGDGILDSEEIGDIDNPRNTDGTDEIDALDSDSDNDGMSDAFEYQNSLNYIDAIDAHVDSDGDGYTNLEEYNAGSDPSEIDSTPNTTPWDFNGDKETNYLDLAAFADHWLLNENDSNWDPKYNLDKTEESGLQVINYLDLAILADHWLE